MQNRHLVESISRHILDDGYQETPVEGLGLFRQSEPTAQRTAVLYEPSICVVAQGMKYAHIGQRTVTYDPASYLLSTLTLPVEMEIPDASPEAPFLGLVLCFDPMLVSTLLAEMDDFVEWPSATPEAGEAIASTPLTEDLARAIARLVDCIDDPLDAKVLGPNLVREILYEALRGPQGHLLRDRVLRDSHANRVARVVTYLEEHFNESLDIDSIAQHAGMSASALHHHFKQVTALSPMQFVKRLRLHQARALLISGRASSEAAFEVGYNSASQFSREFRRLFGVPPSQLRGPRASTTSSLVERP